MKHCALARSFVRLALRRVRASSRNDQATDFIYYRRQSATEEAGSHGLLSAYTVEFVP